MTGVQTCALPIYYFGLPHTFDRTNSEDVSERELVTRLKTETKGRKPANCDTGGDMICDTPSDPYDFRPKVVNCVYSDITIKDANGDLYSPMVNNITARLSKEAEYNFRPDSTWKPTIVANPIISKPTVNSLNNVTITWKDASNNEMDFLWNVPPMVATKEESKISHDFRRIFRVRQNHV